MRDAVQGHDEAIAAMEAALASGNVPHAWLLSGPRGIGKTTLARAFTARLVGADDAARQRIAAGTHGDVLEIAIPPEKREIPVAEARAAMEFLALTPNESTRRVVLIDPAEAMNLNAANALLKTLEEPPAAAVLLLVSHQPGALPPAVRSRCCKLALKVPPHTVFDAMLARAVPGIPIAHRRALHALADGAPGEAVTLHAAGALEVYDAIAEAHLPDGDAARMALAESAAGKDGAARWQLFCRLLPMLYARAAMLAQGAAPTFYLTPSEERALAALAMRAGVGELYDQACALLAEADEYNLNPRSVVLSLVDS